ncbi:MAG: DUF3179 domain-containing (seleno)protein, partial [Acidimicrobiales bacterium]
HENDLVMVDRETGSYWWQVPGRAIVGELSGTSLTPLVSETATWSSWRQRHPETVVLARLPGRDYSRDPFVSYAETVDSGRTPFPVDPDVLADDRLTPATSVIVAESGGEVRAWPVAPERTVVDEVAGIAVEVVTDGVGGRVTADGVPQGVRTSFWFAIVASFPEVTVGP